VYGVYVSEQCCNTCTKFSFLRLINYELEEMENTHFENLTQKTLEELIESGMVLLAMKGHRGKEYFEYSQFIFSLENDVDLPYCNFGRGDIVFLSRENPLTGTVYNLVVLSKTQKEITLVGKGDIPELHEGYWRIDPGISIMTHARYVSIVYASVDMISNKVYMFIVWKVLLFH
jgi:hypothetical protein